MSAATEKELAEKAVGRIVLLMAAKWTVIIVGTKLARRAIEKM